MKIIFLDFDGVLNSEKYVKNCGEYGVIIDPLRIILLKQIVDATNAKIVLSTSWREHWDKENNKCDSIGRKINEIFKKYNLSIFDKTPKLHNSREEEIKEWLKRHPETQNFVVLDDMLLGAKFLEGHFVKTSNFFNGLEENDVEKATEILNG